MVAETEAPLLPYEELLAGAVCEEPQAERAERLKAAAAAKAELAAASEQVSAAALALCAVLASNAHGSNVRYICAVCVSGRHRHVLNITALERGTESKLTALLRADGGCKGCSGGGRERR